MWDAVAATNNGVVDEDEDHQQLEEDHLPPPIIWNGIECTDSMFGIVFVLMEGGRPGSFALGTTTKAVTVVGLLLLFGSMIVVMAAMMTTRSCTAFLMILKVLKRERQRVVMVRNSVLW